MSGKRRRDDPLNDVEASPEAELRTQAGLTQQFELAMLGEAP
jgi:hypothetical protein